MKKTAIEFEISKYKGKNTKKRRLPCCRYCKDVTPEKIVRARAGVELLQCTTKQARTNIFFKHGCTHHQFETGQLYFREWRNLSENLVLIQRVSLGQKPVGLIMMPYKANNIKMLIEKIFKYHPNISFVHGFNEWGMGILTITCSPYTTLFDLYERRNKMEKYSVMNLIVLYIQELKSRCIKDYLVPGGFDMQSQLDCSKVNVFESALLFGYPLDLAASCDTLFFDPCRPNNGLLQ